MCWTGYWGVMGDVMAEDEWLMREEFGSRR
jgi:hypothetical protein